MKKQAKQFTSLLCVLVLCLTLLPVSALASGLEEPGTPKSTPTASMSLEPSVEPSPEPTPEESTEPELVDSAEPTPVPTETPAPENETELFADDSAVYVSANGAVDGDGTREKPYATLAAAVENAPDGATIYVMTDLIMTESARFWTKHLTITSLDPKNPVTLTRGETVAVVYDPARNNYNPAMIEVGGSSYNQESSLTLTNIILDDAGRRGGDTDAEDDTYFIQAASKDSGDETYGKTEFGTMVIPNTDIVQDAMIATYNNTATITLGAGAVLKNYGGMSAVRISGGVLNMLDGSAIYDDLEGFTRSKGSTITGAETGLYGPAGAIWLQGGEFIMAQGAVIRNMAGRAIYNEAGDVQANGTFSGLTTSENAMWQGSSGAVMHMRVNATATFGPTAVIDGQGATLSGSAIGVLGGCELTMDEGSLVTGYRGGNVLDIGGTAYLNGEITGLTTDSNNGGHAICAQSSSKHYIKIGETANIHNNVCSYGVIYTQGNNGVIDIYGKINDNISTDRGGALVLANNGTHVDVNMYPGAEMSNNVSYQTGGSVMVSCGTFTMYGGTISGNISGAGNVGSEDKIGGGVYVRRGGTFIMKGGEITNNSAAGIGGGLAIILDDYKDNIPIPYVELNGGVISGNSHGATFTGNDTDGYKLETAGSSNDITLIGGSTYSHVNRYFVTGDELSIGNEQIFMDDYDFYIDRIDGVKLGNAAAACETAAENAIETKYENRYMTVKGSFWYQSGDICSLNLRELNYDPTKPLFVGIVETDEAGTPSGQITIQAVGVENGQISLPLRANENGYAVVFVQETETSGIITVTPASLTAYMGGEEGYEGVVGDGTVTTAGSSSFPHPLFLIQAPQGVEIGNLDFQNGNNHWKAVVVNPGTTGNTYYRFEKTGSTTTDVRVQYDNGTGPVMEDYFEPELVGDVYKNYIVSIYGGENGTDGVIAGVGEKHYQILTGEGVLTVRAVEEDQATAVKPVQDSPTTAAEGSAVAVAPADTVYTLNDTGVVLPSDHSVSLLFDEIIASDGINRMTPLQEKVDEFLNGADENRRYEIKYLDLVDANNGNAWVKSSKGVDIYWGYPEGTDSSTQFTLLHFSGLHRDGAQSGFDPNDIDAVTPESVTITNTGYGIMFHVEEGGFSPFALVWGEVQGPDPDPEPEPTPDPEPSDPGSSSGGSTSVRRYDIDASAGRGGDISPDGRVRVRRGENQTFRITPDEGYEIYDVIVDGESVGAVGRYTFENVREDHTISVTFRLIQEEVDTGVSRWLNTEDHIAYLQGYPGGLFGPDDNMTRAEAAQMFYNLLLEQDVASTVSFTDVAPDAWYADAVNALASLGMVEGVGGGLFAPERTITRAEFTVIAMRFAYLPDGGENPFSDVAEDDWFYDQVVGAVQYGWITGYPDGTFGSEDTITRAEVTAIVNRMLNRQADENYVDSHAAELIQFTDLSPAYWAYYDIMEAANGHTYEKSGGAEVWTGIR